MSKKSIELYVYMCTPTGESLFLTDKPPIPTLNREGYRGQDGANTISYCDKLKRVLRLPRFDGRTEFVKLTLAVDDVQVGTSTFKVETAFKPRTTGKPTKPTRKKQ